VHRPPAKKTSAGLVAASAVLAHIVVRVGGGTLMKRVGDPTQAVQGGALGCRGGATNGRLGENTGRSVVPICPCAPPLGAQPTTLDPHLKEQRRGGYALRSSCLRLWIAFRSVAASRTVHPSQPSPWPGVGGYLRRGAGVLQRLDAQHQLL
jgi:hypothetical protein